MYYKCIACSKPQVCFKPSGVLLNYNCIQRNQILLHYNYNCVKEIKYYCIAKSVQGNQILLQYEL